MPSTASGGTSPYAMLSSASGANATKTAAAGARRRAAKHSALSSVATARSSAKAYAAIRGESVASSANGAMA